MLDLKIKPELRLVTSSWKYTSPDTATHIFFLGNVNDRSNNQTRDENLSNMSTTTNATKTQKLK